ncbi:MAG: ABC transporter permease subunit [Planctomycetia bacterium]|nr:ABC transporter permease subunit [Planctomycetia bacterium]
MNFILTLLVLVAGVLFTQKGIPYLIKSLMSLVGVKVKSSPLTEKRIRRFKSISRGYYSFVIITSLFTTSLFLEVLVNDKPVMIRYGYEVAYPAVRDLVNTWCFFVEGPLSTYDRSGDFGVLGDGPLDYTEFSKMVEQPGIAFGPIALEQKQQISDLELEIEDIQLEVDDLESDGEEPEDWLVEDLKAARDQLQKLREGQGELAAIEAVFARGDAGVLWPLYRHGPYKNRLDLPGTAPHAPSLYIPGLTPKSQVARLGETLGVNYGGRPGVRVEAFSDKGDPQSLETGTKFFVVQEETVAGIVLVRLVAEDGQSADAEVISLTPGATLLEGSRLATRFLDTWEAPLGTSDAGIDVLPLLTYGFRVSVGFSLMVLIAGYLVGILAGAVMGYYGGWTDILLQRFIEIWGSVPFLFLIMIVASIIDPGFWLLVFLLVILRSWMAITYQIRGEFYREKARDYVQAAIGTGVSDMTVMMRHILPNSMVPVISRAPFSFVTYISMLVSLDFLGFGLPPTDPSWGRLLNQGFQFLTTSPHLVFLPVLAMATTLFLVVLIGEAVREAFDPKVFSRLR